MASLGAGLRPGGLEGAGGARVLGEAGAGARLLHRRLHFHPDTDPRRAGAEGARGAGAQGGGPHLRQPGGWHAGAHGHR